MWLQVKSLDIFNNNSLHSYSYIHWLSIFPQTLNAAGQLPLGGEFSASTK